MSVDLRTERAEQIEYLASHLLSRAALLVRLRSEEHTSELQSQSNLVCRLLLETKKREHRWVIYGVPRFLPRRRAVMHQNTLRDHHPHRTAGARHISVPRRRR